MPQAPRKRRRDWGKYVARCFCLLLALVGVVPVALGLLVKAPFVRNFVARETSKLAKEQGVIATYEVGLSFFPLAVELRNVRVESTDGGGPFLEARRAIARPRLFALMAGELEIDQIEVDSPKVRVVLKDGKLGNLGVKLPEGGSKKAFHAPFAVVSVSDAEVRFVVDNVQLTATDVDADVTAANREDGSGGSDFEVALRVGSVRSQWLRLLEVADAKGRKRVEVDAEDDALCDVDGRVRIEKSKLVVRRFTARGGADLDPAGDTSPGCDLPESDPRRVEIALHQTTILLPEAPAVMPRIDGRVMVRAPVALASRIAGTPDMAGWVKVAGELRFSSAEELPDFKGSLEAQGVRVDRYTFAQEIKADLTLHKDTDPAHKGSQVIESPRLTVRIAEGMATLTDVKVRPLELASEDAVTATVDVKDVSFTRLMAELGVSQHAHVLWDIKEVHLPSFRGSITPLKLDGDFVAHTGEFAVFDSAVDDPRRKRAVGVHGAQIRSHLAVRPDGVSFVNARAVTGSSVVDAGVVFIGYKGGLRVDIPSARVDLEELSPVGDVKMQGIAEVEVHVGTTQSDPRLEGDVKKITDFSVNGMPFGTVDGGRASLKGLALELFQIKGTKGTSRYEMPTARLDFGGPASMRLDAVVTSNGFFLRERLASGKDAGLFSIFHLDEDPRLDPIDGKVGATAKIHVALGGPEDKCGGGFISVLSSVDVKALSLFGEHFEDGHGDFEYRWYDPQAGIEGAEILVPSMTLHKVHREGKGPVGSAIGSLQIQRGGEIRGNIALDGLPLSRIDSLGSNAAAVDGAVSVVARIGGKVSAFHVSGDADVTPLRLRGKKLGGSHVHFAMTPAPPKPQKPVGHTGCQAPIYPAFDKEAWLADTSSAGDFIFNGDLFDHQIELGNLTLSREKSQKLSGRVLFRKVDLGLVLGIASYSAPKDLDAGEAIEPTEVTGGELSADMDIERLRFDDLANAKVSFAPKSLSFFRGSQRLTWRPTPVQILYDDDRIALPPLAFEILSNTGFRGAFTLSGDLARVSSKDPKLNLVAELLPIDLGLFTGVVPKLTRATGKLSGSVGITGHALQPDIAGNMKVRDGELTVQGLPSVISSVNIDIVADKDEIRMTRATGNFAGGDISITGRTPLKGSQLGVMEAKVLSQGIRLKPAEGVTAAFDTNLRVTFNALATGTGAARLPHVSGEVTLTSFEYTRGIGLDINNTLRGGARRTEVKGYDPALDSIVVGPDLIVRATAPLRIRNNLVEAQLAIGPQGLQVSGTDQRVGLRGELKALPGGRFHLLANDFDIQQAVIKFDDPSRIAPFVDIVATTDYRRFATSGGGSFSAATVSGRGGGLWRINMHAYGDAEDLRLDMSADPTLSREDIFLLLTIGLTRTELDQVRLGEVATAAAFQALGSASGADRAVTSAIPIIDDFRFGSAYSPRTGRTEPQVTVGRRLTDDVRASITKGLTDDQLRGNVEWRLSRTTSIRATADNVNNPTSATLPNIGLDLRFRLEFE